MTLDPRKPLIYLVPEERARRLQEMGLDENMVPLTASDAERQAANLPIGGFKVETTPLLSPKAITILGAIGSLLGLAASAMSGIAIIPIWAPFALSAVGAICMNLAGRSLPALVVGGKSLAPEKFIPLFKAGAVAIGTFASTLTPGLLQGGALLLASVLYGIAGMVAPQDTKTK